MSFATVTYNGTGAQTAFAVPFGLLAANELHAKVDGVEVDPDDFTVSQDKTTVTFDVAPPSGTDNVIIYRVTDVDDDDRPVDFSAGSTVTASQLDTMVLHLLHALQEAKDAGDGSLTIPPGEFDWDAEGNRIRNVGAPVDPDDAVRKSDLDSAVIGSGQLPTVSGSDNDSGLAVVAGAWATRTPSQMRVHFGLGTAATLNVGTSANNIPQFDSNSPPRYPANDGRNIDLAQNAETLDIRADFAAADSDLQDQIDALSLASTPVRFVLLQFATTLLTNNTSATWLTDSSGTVGRMDLITGFEYNDDGSFSTTAASDFWTLQPGTYLIEMFLTFINGSATQASSIKWALTNDTGSTVYLDASAQALAPVANVNGHATSHGAVVVVLGSATNIALRARNNLATGAASLLGGTGGTGVFHSHVKVTKLA